MIKEKIKIRKATEEDYQAINALYFETYNLYHQNIAESYKKTPKNPLSKGDFLNMLEDRNALVTVATINDQIVGFIYIYVEKEESNNVAHGYHRVSIAELSVLPDYQRSGVGSRLIKGAEKWAKDHKIYDLTVLVHAFNKKATIFYEKQGYKPYSIQLNRKIK